MKGQRHVEREAYCMLHEVPGVTAESVRSVIEAEASPEWLSRPG